MQNDTCSSPECNEPRKPKGATGPRSPYCSARCRNRADYLRHRSRRLGQKRKATAEARKPRMCPECQAEFTPELSSKRIYCTAKCAKRARNRTYVARRSPCSVPDCANKSRLAGLCRRHHPDGASWGQGNPETRRASLRRKTQKRRALIFDPAAEDICRDEIGERDGWTCGLCSEPVDRTLLYPEPLSASLDHILPLSLGGRHIVSNVQISHLTCNVQKGNRVGDTTQSRDAAA